jgi:tetratricopeptide (TPR) repeat protein
MPKLITALLASALALSAIAPAMAFSGTMGGTGSIENVREVKDALDKFRDGDADGAIALLTGVLATNGLPDEQSAIVLYDRGKIYLSKGDKEKAVDDFSAAIGKRPRYQPPYIMLAQTYFDAGEPAKGIAELKAALEVDPDSAPAHLNLANAYHHEHDDDHALAEYDEAIRFQSSAFAYEGRGSVYLLKGQPGKAVSDFSAAIAMKPDYLEAYVNRGMA